MVEILSALPWLLLIILTPLVGVIGALIFSRSAPVVGVTVLTMTFLLLISLALSMSASGVQHYTLSGLVNKLNLALYADGLSLLMLSATCLVSLAISVYASAYFSAKQSRHFWPLWLLLFSLLNALFLCDNVFVLFSMLLVIGLISASLVRISANPEALYSAKVYRLAILFVAVLLSISATLIYVAHDSFAITISAPISSTLTHPLAFTFIAIALLISSALFPLHFWLPSAHASATPPVSATVSALVLKASIYILLRLWLGDHDIPPSTLGNMFSYLGAAAIIWGSLQALRQTTLKLLVAYSTVAQMGYLFLAFGVSGSRVWLGVMYLLLSHALAKAAMALAVGNILRSGDGNIAELSSVVQRLPYSAAAFAIAGVSLIGLPPSAGFIGKWLFLEEAIAQQRWFLVGVMIGGGVLTAAYVFKVLSSAFTPASSSPPIRGVYKRMQWSAMTLACFTIILGFLAMPLSDLIAIGDPFAIAPQLSETKP